MEIVKCFIGIHAIALLGQLLSEGSARLANEGNRPLSFSTPLIYAFHLLEYAVIW
jgi:hypothetical protein